MPRKGLNEYEFKQKLIELYNGEIELCGHYKSLTQPILVKNKYGVMYLPKANQVLFNKPGIKAALNKTSYFMEQLREVYPEIAKKLVPISEYTTMKSKMLFNTQFGVVSVSPDMLMQGAMPGIRLAINRKEYMRNQLLYLYDNKYDFEIFSTNRHEGKCKLICPIHGEVLIDNDYIFSGCGCIKCNSNWEKSNTLYIIRLYNEIESFYKLGITYIKNGNPRRYRDYKKLGYSIEEIYLKTFDSYEECAEKELRLKRLIKPYLYQPKIWSNNYSTECFSENLLDIVINQL